MNFQPRLLPFLSLLCVTAFCGTNLLATTAMAQTATAPSHKEKKGGKEKPTAQSNSDNQDQDDDGLGNDDKNPTQALFDAINTGNLNAAQDALGRGADLRATNVLGQTPLEMSVDLNRDRITFLLLSMRGYNNSPQTLANASVSVEPSAITVKNGKGHMSVKGKNKQGKFLSAQHSPIFQAQDGGVPKPEIGFLGFQNK
ncbi:ankyrin repeat domain-containing protein [Commensalibacter oyaizuii]|uniref:Ankyrin repeat domain-containing protein n=1 Tax=Commensalibacter oyaizuii TaxID=3043873 RepID=A0ABT6Q1N9_9PROT|nr:ankyrin repeat domain-containing protein [Commensalibacter sp. TBRC 16381]MDI2090656.1 ankyrin repeat domain-containing protein [Commensalibacter sp. TBRC 16381]